ncbi:response regulator [Streptacidiphilus sp. EB103A]|uniref:response regulator n=1 Tax=Streptacidiphilus sp. EB103A TaxID=3156275 RepID=UPI0035148676
MTRILVVDDEPQMLRALQINLQARQYDVTTAADGTLALEETARSRPDAIILDLGLPGLDGLEVLAALRVWSTVPVIVVSGRSSATEKVAALDAGADDYVTKPFAMNELLARVRAVLRRPPIEGAPTGVAVIGDYTVDLASCTVSPRHDGVAAVRLTPTEWGIITLLIQHPGRLVTGTEILHSVWGPGHEGNTNYLRVYVAGIRRKLETDPAHPRHLRTEPGMGYRYDP